MVFRAFLEQGKQRPDRVRAHVGSGLLHAGVILLLIWVARMELLAPTSLLPAPAIAVSLVRPVSFRGAPRTAAAGSAERPTAAPARARRAAPRPRPAAPLSLPPVAPVSLDPVWPAGDSSRAPMAVSLLPGEASGGGGDGAELGDGGEGGFGESPGRRRRPTLFARVIGSGIRSGTPLRADKDFVSLKEATALRTHDFFPRLPAAMWTERGPYLVALEVCVSEEGQVSEAVLRSHASDRLDPQVLAAVRGWRYRPRMQDGRAVPFCHGVLIRYDLSY